MFSLVVPEQSRSAISIEALPVQQQPAMPSTVSGEVFEGQVKLVLPDLHWMYLQMRRPGATEVREGSTT